MWKPVLLVLTLIVSIVSGDGDFELMKINSVKVVGGLNKTAPLGVVNWSNCPGNGGPGRSFALEAGFCNSNGCALTSGKTYKFEFEWIWGGVPATRLRLELGDADTNGNYFSDTMMDAFLPGNTYGIELLNFGFTFTGSGEKTLRLRLSNDNSNALEVCKQFSVKFNNSNSLAMAPLAFLLVLFVSVRTYLF